MSTHDIDTYKQPVAEESIATNEVTAVTPWEEAREQLEEAQKYWLATVQPNGQPHVMPLFAVWSEGCLYFTAGETTRKAKNLAQSPHCVITVAGQGLDLIVEGEAVKVSDKARLQRVADVYASKYDWHITVRDGAYFAEYGAPSAGPPPYELYEIRLMKAFGLGTAEPYGATRWCFS
ncbi:MAG: pyridoxamine 5'-phosphate oxidase family protein [Chitinophagaceae bacterium]|nr:pyridoxamine 5'-phosphate oxidase family protein [Anaerolineae bacterium]